MRDVVALVARAMNFPRVVILGMLAATPLAAAAQRATGVVRDSTSSEPVAGAVVSALDSLKHTVARSITDATGRYFVELPATAAQLRIVRIGYQPRAIVMPRVRGQVVTIDVGMLKLATLLSTVLVNDERVCSADKDRVGALSLWDQARAGLLTAVVAREAHPVNATIMSFQRVIDLANHRVVSLSSRILSGNTTRPFLAADAPSVLAERGYMENTADAGQLFKAPDADVLLDDSFATTHCFSVVQPDTAHTGAIGLAFEPARGRDTLVDVSGVLWLEAGVPAIRSIEFTYTDKAGVLKRNNAGGIMTFASMPNGVVFIANWTLRLPAPDTSRQRAINRAGRVIISSFARVTHSSETGGTVLRADWADSSHYASPLKTIDGTITERGTQTPMANAFVALQASGEAYFTDSLGRFSMYPILPGRYMVDAADTTLAEYVPPRLSPFEINVAPGRVLAPLHLELQSRKDAIRALCTGFEVPDAATLLGRLADSGGTSKVPDDVRIVAEWLQSGSTNKRETQTVSVDEKGRFSVCGIPRERAVLLTATHKGIRYADTPVAISATAVIEAMEWTLDFHGLTNAVAQKVASLRGHVVRTTSGGGIAGAEVWFPTVDRRATTDSSGAFRIDSLPPGPLLVQIRTLGYGMRRDTVTIAEGRDVTREFALENSATLLDTIRTVASGTKRLSPALKGFESRRALGMGGYFISDSTLREHDGQALSSIIMSRAPGAQLVPGRSGASYMVSVRKPCAGSVMSQCSTPNCYVTTYLDGVRIYIAGEAGGPPTDLQRIQISDLAGVEFYPSAGVGPPEFNSTGSGCGTLVLWTRER